MLTRIEAALVEDWRDCLKWSSVRLIGVVVFLNALAQIMPALDPNIAKLLPEALRDPATGVYSLLILAARMTKLKANG